MNLREQKTKIAFLVEQLRQLCWIGWWICTVKGLLLARVPRLVHISDLVLSLSVLTPKLSIWSWILAWPWHNWAMARPRTSIACLCMQRNFCAGSEPHVHGRPAAQHSGRSSGTPQNGAAGARAWSGGMMHAALYFCIVTLHCTSVKFTILR